jgi:hypothetical protein
MWAQIKPEHSGGGNPAKWAQIKPNTVRQDRLYMVR